MGNDLGKRGPEMSINLPLDPHQEALLAALARSKGLSSDDLVREVIEKMIATVPADVFDKQPTRSLRGLLSKYGPTPSPAEIDANRNEMFANFPRADF